MASSALVWLRNDLRLHDNPALLEACNSAEQVTAIYIHETDPELRPRGAASRWWLHHSLVSLGTDLAALGIRLLTRTGLAAEVLTTAAAEISADAVYWNRRYSGPERQVDHAARDALTARDIAANECRGSLLLEPEEIATKTGGAYGVFTPFWNALRSRDIPDALPAPAATRKPITPESADSEYRTPFWAHKMEPYWEIGEQPAHQRLQRFLEAAVHTYPADRDHPSKAATSRLSPYLAHGEISPRTVWTVARAAAHSGEESHDAVDKFLSELAWRDFNTHQLFRRPDIATIPMQSRFGSMAYLTDSESLGAWQRGQTGIPIVDAGMRELWETGYMENRVRLLAASLLVKNLLIDWRLGEQWFWDCLCDADAANNPGNWQWVAGSGNDASPFFRIFNPVTQGENFDPLGDYVRRWVPELAAVPDKYIQRPSEAPADVLGKAKVEIGRTYPRPIVDLKLSRERALAAFRALSQPQVG